jgi:hypothetical protein
MPTIGGGRSTKMAADPRRTAIPVVDDDDLAPMRCTPIAAQQPPAVHAAGLLNHNRIALAHLAVGAAYVIKTSRVVLRRRWYESALRLRRR